MTKVTKTQKILKFIAEFQGDCRWKDIHNHVLMLSNRDPLLKEDYCVVWNSDPALRKYESRFANRGYWAVGISSIKRKYCTVVNGKYMLNAAGFAKIKDL